MDKGLIKMESDSNYGGSSSSRIQNLVEDFGDESFETRNEALMTLKAMLPHSEVSISNNLVEIISEHGDDEAGSSTSFVNKGAIELFQNMSELGLEPLVNDLLRNGDEYARRVATDALGRTGRMAVLPYLIESMNDSDMYVRWQAAKGLGRFAGSSDARDALVDSMDDSKPYVRKRVARSLEVFGGAGPVDETVEGPMEKDGKGDIDGDGIPDELDNDDDNDGIPDTSDENPNDHDNDGIEDNEDNDDDGDGVDDELETQDGDSDTDIYDHDNDGINDAFDLSLIHISEPTRLLSIG